MRVEILPNGQYILNGQYVTLTDIQNAIQNANQTSKINDFIIEADENTLEKYVVALMDVAKQNGIQNILIATRMKR